jgi:hypothetical protein
VTEIVLAADEGEAGDGFADGRLVLAVVDGLGWTFSGWFLSVVSVLPGSSRLGQSIPSIRHRERA